MGTQIITLMKTVTYKSEVIHSDDYVQNLFLGAGIMALFLLLSLVELFCIALKRHDGNIKKLDKYEKCMAKVIGYSNETVEKFGRNRTYNLTYDEMEIEYHDGDGNVFRKFTQRVDDVESIDIYYKKSDHEIFKSAYLLEEDEEYVGGFVYGISQRILFGTFTGLFAVLMIGFLVKALINM